MSSKALSVVLDKILPEDVKRSVLVCGVPEVQGDVTDKLEIFFGKRANGGGDIDEVTLIDKNMALIQFSKDNVVESVVDKSPHLFYNHEIVAKPFEEMATEAKVGKPSSTPTSFSSTNSFVGKNEDYLDIFETVNVTILTDQHPYIFGDFSDLQRISQELGITMVVTKTKQVIKLEGDWNAINDFRLQCNDRYSGKISQQLRKSSEDHQKTVLPESQKVRTFFEDEPGLELFKHRNRLQHGRNKDDCRQDLGEVSRSRHIKYESSERTVTRRASDVEISEEDSASDTSSDTSHKTKVKNNSINHGDEEYSFQRNQKDQSPTSYPLSDQESNSASSYSVSLQVDESNLPGSEIFGSESHKSLSTSTVNYTSQSHLQQESPTTSSPSSQPQMHTSQTSASTYAQKASANSYNPQQNSFHQQQTTPNPLQTIAYPQQTASYVSPYTFNFDGLKITVKYGDITQERVHTIVSSIATDLSMAGGLAKVVAAAGGKKIKEECERLRKKSPRTRGDFFTVNSGNLKCTRVMFVVMPEYDRSKTKRDKMTQTCKGVLKTLNETEATSAAIPGLGTGAFHYPSEAFIDGMMHALRDELQNPRKRTFQEVVLIDQNSSIVQSLISALTNFSKVK